MSMIGDGSDSEGQRLLRDALRERASGRPAVRTPAPCEHDGDLWDQGRHDRVVDLALDTTARLAAALGSAVESATDWLQIPAVDDGDAQAFVAWSAAELLLELPDTPVAPRVLTVLAGRMDLEPPDHLGGGRREDWIRERLQVRGTSAADALAEVLARAEVRGWITNGCPGELADAVRLESLVATFSGVGRCVGALGVLLGASVDDLSSRVGELTEEITAVGLRGARRGVDAELEALDA